MRWQGWRHGVLVAALLGSAGCAHGPRLWGTAQYGDTGPGGVVLVDARCTRSEDCTVIDAWDGDPCHCDAEWRAANVGFAERWRASGRGHNAFESGRDCGFSCGPTRPPPELALCIDFQCVAIRREEAGPLHMQLAPYLNPPPAQPCPEPPASP